MAEDSQEKLEKQLASLKMQMQELTGIIETDIESSKALKGSLNDSLQGLRDELEKVYKQLHEIDVSLRGSINSAGVLERLRLIENKAAEVQADTWKLPKAQTAAVITAVISGILALLSQIVAGIFGMF
jgi:nitrate/nitrite-specific signal transduction histidine kinase